jgi:hypothetical protein
MSLPRLFAISWVTGTAFALASLTMPWQLTASPADEFEQVSALSFDRFPRFFRSESGEWTFLRYDSTGNGAEILRLDPLTGTTATLVRGLEHQTLSLLLYSDARVFLASGRKYGDQGSGTFLFLGEHRAPAALREWRINVSPPPSQGYVAGNRIYLVSGGPYTRHPSRVHVLDTVTGAEVAVYPIEGSSLWALPDGTMLMTGGRTAKVYDPNFRELATLHVPNPVRLNSNCPVGPVKSALGKLFIGAGCGNIEVYDLASRRHEYTIPATSNLFVSFDLYAQWLFVAPGNDPNRLLRVYDTRTGHEQGRVPITGAHSIGVSGDYLTAIAGESQKAVVTTYKISTEVLRQGSATARILAAYPQALAIYTEANDPYRAADHLEAAGIRRFVMEAPETVAVVLREYAGWLSRTFNRREEGLALARRLGPRTEGLPGSSDPTDPLFPVFDEDSSLARGLRRPTPIDFGAFWDHFYFDGDRLIVARWKDSADLAVYDRQTLALRQTVPIAPRDDQYQDSISGLAFLGNRLYVQVAYRYPDDKRMNLVTLDRNTLRVLRRGHARVEQLVVAGNDLFDCGCGQQFSDNVVTCRGLRSPSLAATGKTLRVPSRPACERDGRMGDIVQGERLTSKIGTAKVVGYNNRFAVLDLGTYQQPKYEALRMADASRVPIDLPWLSSAQQFVPTLDPDRWLIVDSRVDQMRWIAFDTPRSRPSTLLRVEKFGYLYTGASALHGSYLYVGLGRDLLVHDIRSNATLYYERNFVVSSRPEKKEGLDYDRLQLFLVDRDRLIAITRDGAGSQTLDLLPFERKLESLRKQSPRGSVETLGTQSQARPVWDQSARPCFGRERDPTDPNTGQ